MASEYYRFQYIIASDTADVRRRVRVEKNLRNCHIVASARQPSHLDECLRHGFSYRRCTVLQSRKCFCLLIMQIPNINRDKILIHFELQAKQLNRATSTSLPSYSKLSNGTGRGGQLDYEYKKLGNEFNNNLLNRSNTLKGSGMTNLLLNGSAVHNNPNNKLLFV